MLSRRRHRAHRRRGVPVQRRGTGTDKETYSWAWQSIFTEGLLRTAEHPAGKDVATSLSASSPEYVSFYKQIH